MLEIPRDKLIAWARSKVEIDELHVFGSYARGKATEISDLDIAFSLNFHPEDVLSNCFDRRQTWCRELSKLTGIRVKDLYLVTDPEVENPVLVYRR